MPKLSQQAKENIAWVSGALLLLLLISRAKKAQTTQAVQEVQQPQPATPIAPTLPQEAIQPTQPIPIVEQPVLHVEPKPAIIQDPYIYQPEPGTEIIYDMPSGVKYPKQAINDYNNEGPIHYGGSYGSGGYGEYAQYF